VVDIDPVAIIDTLNHQGVRYVVVGGIAAVLRGAAMVTFDLDITPDTERDNLESISAALIDLGAKLRTAADPAGVPFPIDPAMLAAASSWTLVTRHGDLDLVFEPAGTGGYADLVRDADTLRISIDPEVHAPVASLADIIRSKEAAGRAKDEAVLPLLRRTQDEIDRG